MTAKEKAQDLYTSFRAYLSLPNAPLGDLKDEIAITCSEHVAWEMGKECKAHNSERESYWVQVKQEIEKL